MRHTYTYIRKYNYKQNKKQMKESIILFFLKKNFILCLKNDDGFVIIQLNEQF
jgi:hypothetical protein